MRLFFSSLLCFLSLSLSAQVICPAADSQKLEALFENLRQADLPAEPGDRAVAIGQMLLGTSYVAQTLEVGEAESLVINLRGLDCTTFLENVLVLSRLSVQGALNLAAFRQELLALRYRDGQLDGYPSRLHYLTEWLDQQARAGHLTLLSEALGGIPYDKDIHFMSAHPDSYPRLKDDPAAQAAIREVEAQLRARSPHYVPKGEVAAIEGQLQNGDLIAFTTPIKGLDVVHVGFAVRKNGRTHLLHASTGSMQVEISPKPLPDYLAGNRLQSGIMVARLLP